MKKAKKNRLQPLKWVLPNIWLCVTLIPFVYMVMTSLRSNADLMTNGSFSLPNPWYLGNYARVMTSNFPRYFVNSVVVVSVALVLVTLLSAMGAYVFARLCVNWSKPAYSIVVACMSIPIHITLLPVFIMMRDAGLYNTVWALIPTYVTFYLPISTFIMTGYMKGISKEIEEAALIDGASLFKIFYQIILPLSAPGLATICIYDAIYFWNEFSFALVLTQNEAARTIPLAVWDFKAEYDVDTAGIMAVLTLSAVPLIIVYAFAQEKLVKGLMAGAVKG